jgi:AraC-like DNA-binding protein
MYRERPPSPDLRAQVSCYWTTQAPGGSHRVLPDGCIDLILDLERGRARVVGTMTTAAVVSASRYDALAVRFRPGEAAGLLGLDAPQLTDTSVELEQLWGPAARELLEQVQERRDDRMRIELLEQALRGRLGARWADWRVRRATQALEQGGLPVPAVAAEVGLGERQLERLFRERVGVGPKRFARIARLQRVLPLLGTADLATVAVVGGFSDSSHVVREVRALCGVTPSALSAERQLRAMSETSNAPAEPRATPLQSQMEG